MKAIWGWSGGWAGRSLNGGIFFFFLRYFFARGGGGVGGFSEGGDGMVEDGGLVRNLGWEIGGWRDGRLERWEGDGVVKDGFLDSFYRGSRHTVFFLFYLPCKSLARCAWSMRCMRWNVR